MSNAPAGWYPVDGTSQRYWDGTTWTEHVAPLAGAPESPADAQPQPGSPPGPQPGSQTQPGSQPQSPAQPPGPQDVPGSGFPAGIGETHQPTPPAAEQAWGTAPAGIPYSGHTPAPLQTGAPVASTSDDRSMAVLCHVLGIFTGFIGPLIIWLMKKDTSPYVDMHGKAALNFQFSLMIYWIISFIAIFILIGIFMILALMALGVILPIVAAVAANKGQGYKYPLSIPFFS